MLSKQTIYTWTRTLFTGLIVAPVCYVLFLLGELTPRPGMEWITDFFYWATVLFAANLVVMVSAVFFYAYKNYRKGQ